MPHLTNYWTYYWRTGAEFDIYLDIMGRNELDILLVKVMKEIGHMFG